MIARIRKSMEEKEGGFTLIELLVVIIIIGILAAIAIPVFLSQRKKGYDAQAESDVRNLGTLEETYLTDHSAYGGAGDVAIADHAKLAANDTVYFYEDGNIGFCLIGNNSASKNWWVYDSQAGGFASSPVTLASGATTPTVSLCPSSASDTNLKAMTSLPAGAASGVTGEAYLIGGANGAVAQH